MPREKARQHGMVCLPNQNKLIPLILDDHRNALGFTGPQLPVHWKAGWIGDYWGPDSPRILIMRRGRGGALVKLHPSPSAARRLADPRIPFLFPV